MACELKQGPPGQNKDVVLMRPLRDMNFPKFVFEVFLGLIADFFPGLDCPRVHYPKFNDAMEGVPSDGKHIQLPHRVGKVVQTMLKWLHLHDGGLNWRGLGCGIVYHCAGWCLWIQRSWDTTVLRAQSIACYSHWPNDATLESYFVVALHGFFGQLLWRND
eukprot:Em0887g2a